MKRKVNTVEATPQPTCAAIGPEDMVLVTCDSGESFLIERNCALLSSRCRDVLQLWDSAIRRMAVQCRGERSTTTSNPAAGGEAPAVGFPAAARQSMARPPAEPVENPNMTIPFMAAWDASDASTAASPCQRVRQVPLTVVAEAYQLRLDAAAPTRIERPSSSKITSSHGERKGVMVVPKPVSALAPLQEADGTLLYPVVELPHITPSILEAALSYAAKKYRMDVDGEKLAAETVPPVSAIATGDEWQTIAAAVLTGM